MVGLALLRNMRGWGAAAGALAALLCVASGSGAVPGALGSLSAQTGGGRVMVVDVQGKIDDGLASYVARSLEGAGGGATRHVVIRIDTPGGALNAALAIKDAILDAPVPTTALVRRQAFSAGALIAIAAEDIYVAPGGVMGAATPVRGDTGEKASAKVVSAVRKAFAATAEHRGRDPRVAEAMVDASVAVPGLVQEGELLTLTAQEALQWGYADGRASGLEELLSLRGLEGLEVVETRISPAEQAVRFLTNPVASSLLISLGFLGLLFELQTAGWGAGGALGLLALSLFFFGHYLAGLAGWEGIALVLVGLVLVALEALVVPGFGVAGILGTVSLLGGLFISLAGLSPSGAQAAQASYVLAGSVALVVVGAWASLTFLPRTRGFRGLVLADSLARATRPSRLGTPETDRRPDLRALGARSGPVPAPGQPSLEGATGVAVTDLRPSGTARIHGGVVDVVTEGEYVEAGRAVAIVRDEGYRRVVRPVDQQTG